MPGLIGVASSCTPDPRFKGEMSIHDGHSVAQPGASVLVVCPDSAARSRLSATLGELLPIGADLRSASSLDQALCLPMTTRPDVLFFDTRYGDDSMEGVMARLDCRASVIFLAKAPEDAQKALDAGAIDCVLSPCRPERLEHALLRALTWTTLNQPWNGHRATSSVAAHTDAAHEAAKNPARWLRVVSGDELLVVEPSEVVYLQAHRKITRVIMRQAEGIIRAGINTIAARLDTEQFWRLHRSTIVNAAFVSGIQRDDLGRAAIRLRGKPEVLHANRVQERFLLRDGFI